MSIYGYGRWKSLEPLLPGVISRAFHQRCSGATPLPALMAKGGDPPWKPPGRLLLNVSRQSVGQGSRQPREAAPPPSGARSTAEVIRRLECEQP